jgi:hypothetical protein
MPLLKQNHPRDIPSACCSNRSARQPTSGAADLLTLEGLIYDTSLAMSKVVQSLVFPA